MYRTIVSDNGLCQWSRLVRFAVVLGVAAVLAAGCSGDDSGDAGDGSVVEANGAGDSAGQVVDAGDSDGGSEDSDGSAGGGDDAGADANGSQGAATGPIKIGLHNMEGGALSFTQISGAVGAAVADINERGGINGRELDLFVCGTDGSPESSIDCGNKFVEENVVAAVQGLDIGADAMLPILADAGIPEVGYLPFTPSQRFAVDEAAFFGSPLEGNALAVMLLLEDLGVERVAVLSTEAPTTRGFHEDVVEPMAESFRIEVESIFYPPVGADWTLVMSAALAGGADAVVTIGAPEPDCVGMLSALNGLEFDGPVLMGACSAFVSVLQDQAVGVYTYSDFWWPTAKDLADSDTREEIESYVAAMERADFGAFSGDGLAIRAYATVENLASALATIEGPVNAEAVMDTLRTSGSHDGFMGQPFNCDGSAWPGDTACSLGVVIWRVNDQLTLDMVSDGYLDLSEHRPAS